MQNYSVNGTSILILRLMVSGIFIVAGTNHLLFTDKVLNRLNHAPMLNFASSFGNPETLIMISGRAMLLGGIALLFGILTRWAALGLILVLVPITISVQFGQWSTAGPLFKNIAILGVLLFFVINGSVVYGLDQFKRKKITTP